MDYLSFFKGLNEAGADYLVAGGLAVNLYGVPRMTYDIDIVVSLRKENVLRTIEYLEREGFRPRAPVPAEQFASPAARKRWREEKGMKAFSLFHDRAAIGEVDILFDLPLSWSTLKRSAVVMTVRGISIPVVSREHLIVLKTRTGRAQDRADVKALRKVGR